MMASILTQCRLKWEKGVKLDKRKTPRLIINAYLFNVESYETIGRCVIEDKDGWLWLAEYTSYEDAVHDYDLLKKTYVLELKKRAGREAAQKRGAPPKDPTGGHTPA